MTIQLPDIAAKLRIDDSALAAVQGKFASFGQNLQSFGQGATKALTLPFIGFGALAVKEAGEAAKATGQTEAVIKSTGGAAGVTTKQILSLSDSLGKVAGVEGEVVQEGANMLLTFCLEASAEALTLERGWVTHDQLHAGDQILGYDPETDLIEWQPVDSMHRFAVHGDLIRWKSKQIDIASTPHHRWWTVDSSGYGEYTSRFRTTEDISGKQVYVKIGGGTPSAFAGEPSYTDEIVELAGWVMTEGWFPKWKDQTGRHRVGLRLCGCGNPARNKAGPARCDSCAHKPIQSGRTTPRDKVTAETARHYSVGLCQSDTANTLAVKRIRLLMERLRMQGHRISERSSIAPYNGSTMIEWSFGGDLGRTIRELLPGKKLTVGFLTKLTATQGELLFNTLVAGDGHVDRYGHQQFIQKDHAQLDLVAMLAAMLGRRSTVLDRGGNRDSLYFPDTNHLTGHSVHAKPERYEGVVWCPHLRTGIFMARNNGRTFWTGNTNVKNEAGKGNDVFNQATKTLLDMSTAMGTEPKQAAIQLGKALNDPIKGITALSRVGVTFTDQQKAQIKALVEAGDTMGAQKIILAELNREFGGSAKAAGDNLGPLERLKLAGADLAESFGTIILPMVQKLATVFVSLAEKFQNLSPEAQKTIVTVGAIAAAVGPVLIVAGKLVQSFSLVSGAFKAMSAVFAANPFLLIAAAAIAIVILIVKNWDTIKAKTIEIWNAIKSFLDGIWNGIKGTASGIWDGIKNFFSGTWNAIKATGEAIWNGIKNSLTAIFNGIKTAVTTVFDGIKSFLTGTWNGIKAGVTSAWDFIKDKITGSINSIKTAVSRVADAIGDFFRDMWEKAKDYVSRIIKKIKELPFVPGSPIPMVVWAGQTRKGIAKQFDGMARDFANFSLPTADSLAPITAPIAVGAPAFAGAGASGVTIENFNVTSQRPDDIAGPVASELGWLLAGVSRGRR